MTDINVIILEPNEGAVSDLKNSYIKMFELCEYTPHFVHATDHGRIIREIDQLAKKSWFVHVVICDLSLGDMRDYTGLSVIKDIKEKYSDILIIGNTNGDVSYQQTAARYPSFDVFANKLLLQKDRNDRYLKQLSCEFTRAFRFNTRISITNDSKIPSKYKGGPLNRDLLSIVSQISFTGHSSDQLVDITDIKLTEITEGKSASDVFRVDAFNCHSNINFVPAVLKISDPEQAKLEIDNYNRFVKWVLPYMWRVDVLGTGFTSKMGGVCFSFIKSGQEAFYSLTHYIEQANNDIIKKTYEKIFNPSAQRWYSVDAIEEQDSIIKFYSKYFPSDSSTVELRSLFRALANKYFGAFDDNGKFDLKNGLFADSPVIKLGNYYSRYKSCICHGDMNSNNLIVSTGGEVIFIDFQATGRGHVFLDFLTLEESVRIYYPHSIENNELLSIEEKISNYDFISSLKDCDFDKLQQPFSHIARIRRLALDNFEKEPFNNYLYGCLAINLRLLRVTDFTDEQIRRIVASLFSITRSLHLRP